MSAASRAPARCVTRFVGQRGFELRVIPAARGRGDLRHGERRVPVQGAARRTLSASAGVALGRHGRGLGCRRCGLRDGGLARGGLALRARAATKGDLHAGRRRAEADVALVPRALTVFPDQDLWAAPVRSTVAVTAVSPSSTSGSKVFPSSVGRRSTTSVSPVAHTMLLVAQPDDCVVHSVGKRASSTRSLCSVAAAASA